MSQPWSAAAWRSPSSLPRRQGPFTSARDDVEGGAASLDPECL